MWTALSCRSVDRSGFSLLEIIIALSLVSLAAALFSPYLTASSRGREASAAARELLLCLRTAHWKAVVSGCRRRLVTFSRTGDPAVWYVIEKEEGKTWLPDGDGHRFPESVHLRVTGDAIKIFNPNGSSSTGSYLLEAPGGRSYRLSLNPLTGRARLYRGDLEVGSEG